MTDLVEKALRAYEDQLKDQSVIFQHMKVAAMEILKGIRKPEFDKIEMAPDLFEKYKKAFQEPKQDTKHFMPQLASSLLGFPIFIDDALIEGTGVIKLGDKVVYYIVQDKIIVADIIEKAMCNFNSHR